MTPTQPVQLSVFSRQTSPNASCHAALEGKPETRGTPVQYCVVDGKPTLVWRKGLRRSDPATYQALSVMALEQGFAMKEDQRERTKSVAVNRRRTLPVLALVSLMVGPVAVAAGEPVAEHAKAMSNETMDAVVVTGKRVDPAQSARTYKVDAGERFVTDPYGDAQAVLTVAHAVRANGAVREVSTRGMVLPQTAVGGFIHRYDYTFPARCGGGTFSYYETEGFSALGYHVKHKVILDALAGGAFAGPRLWGPYDQVIGAKVDMEMLFGNGEQDGMGFLKAAYFIGRTPVMSDRQYAGLGKAYESHVRTAAECVAGHQNFASAKRLPEVAAVP